MSACSSVNSSLMIDGHDSQLASKYDKLLQELNASSYSHLSNDSLNTCQHLPKDLLNLEESSIIELPEP